MQYGLISEDYLMHHGVKGMKWGVRHDPERVGGARGNTLKAKANYKAANKAYNKKFNKWYYGSFDPRQTFTEKGRRKYQTNTLEMYKSAADLAVAKGKYQQAKGIEKNKPKLVAKGKRRAEIATNTRKYYSEVDKHFKAGNSLNDSIHKSRKSYDRLKDKEIDIKAKYRQQYGI